MITFCPPAATRPTPGDGPPPTTRQPRAVWRPPSGATSSGQLASSSDANSSGYAAITSDGITSNRPASSSVATNSYRLTFSCGTTNWAGLPDPPAGPPPPADIEGEFCCLIIFCHGAALHAHALSLFVSSLPFLPMQQQKALPAGWLLVVVLICGCGCGPSLGRKGELF